MDKSDSGPDTQPLTILDVARMEINDEEYKWQLAAIKNQLKKVNRYEGDVKSAKEKLAELSSMTPKEYSNQYPQNDNGF